MVIGENAIALVISPGAREHAFSKYSVTSFLSSILQGRTGSSMPENSIGSSQKRTLVKNFFFSASLSGVILIGTGVTERGLNAAVFDCIEVFFEALTVGDNFFDIGTAGSNFDEAAGGIFVEVGAGVGAGAAGGNFVVVALADGFDENGTDEGGADEGGTEAGATEAGATDDGSASGTSAEAFVTITQSADSERASSNAAVVLTRFKCKSCLGALQDIITSFRFYDLCSRSLRTAATFVFCVSPN